MRSVPAKRAAHVAPSGGFYLSTTPLLQPSNVNKGAEPPSNDSKSDDCVQHSSLLSIHDDGSTEGVQQEPGARPGREIPSCLASEFLSAVSRPTSVNDRCVLNAQSPNLKGECKAVNSAMPGNGGGGLTPPTRTRSGTVVISLSSSLSTCTSIYVYAEDPTCGSNAPVEEQGGGLAPSVASAGSLEPPGP